MRLLLAVIACAFIQVVIGADPMVVFLCTMANLCGLAAFASVGALNVGGWLALFYVLGNTMVAIFAKTLAGQTLDSNLGNPLASFLVQSISSAGMLAAVLLAAKANVGRPIFSKELSPTTLRRFSWACLIAGVAFSVANRLIAEGEDVGTAFGGFSTFRDLLFMAVIARTALVLQESGNERSVNVGVLLFIAVGVFGGLIENQKTQAALPVVAYFATVLFYRRSISRGAVIALGGGALVFVLFMAPVVHALRSLGQQSMPLDERIEFLMDTATRLIENPQELAALEKLASGEFEGGYYNYFGDDGTSQMVLGRFTYIQHSDAVIAEVERRGPMGGDAIWPALSRILPSFITGPKSEYREEFLTILHYGLILPTGGLYPTLPIAAQAYAGYKLPGALLIPFASFLLFLLVLKKLSWSTDRNIFGIFFFVQFVVVYASQGSFLQYTSTPLRGFPVFALLFLVLLKASSVRFGAPRPHYA